MKCWFNYTNINTHNALTTTLQPTDKADHDNHRDECVMMKPHLLLPPARAEVPAAMAAIFCVMLADAAGWRVARACACPATWAAVMVPATVVMSCTATR